MFNFNIDKKILYVIIGVALLLGLRNLTASYLLSIILMLPGIIIAITFHEFAHAYAADKLGDTTPRMQGRVNLNPLSHLDPIGFFMLLFVHLGWGKPVQINPRNFDDSKYSINKCEAIVAAAGPIMNFVLSILFTVIYFAILKFATGFAITDAGKIVLTVINSTIFINIGLGVFNLLPITPLDGSKIFISFLPYKARRFLEEKERIFYLIFLVLWITGLASYIIDPVIDLISTGIFKLIGLLFGLG